MISSLPRQRLLPTIAQVHLASHKGIRGKDAVVRGIINGKKPFTARKGIADDDDDYY